ncbi:MAG TPA: hypothetical protein VFU21_29345, partial [Kofleriaceae bacterium]|nr:hypothetical protein [Kofleriaceae bacterium]
HVTPMPVTAPRRAGSRTDQHWVVGSATSSSSHKVGSRTQPGFLPPKHATGSTTATVPVTATVTVTAPGQTVASLVGKTMPLGLQLSDAEREVLNALGRARSLAAREIAAIARVEDAPAWMEQFLGKLSSIGLDVVIPGDDRDGEPTWILRR